MLEWFPDCRQCLDISENGGPNFNPRPVRHLISRCRTTGFCIRKHLNSHIDNILVRNINRYSISLMNMYRAIWDSAALQHTLLKSLCPHSTTTLPLSRFSVAYTYDWIVELSQVLNTPAAWQGGAAVRYGRRLWQRHVHHILFKQLFKSLLLKFLYTDRLGNDDPSHDRFRLLSRDNNVGTLNFLLFWRKFIPIFI